MNMNKKRMIGFLLTFTIAVGMVSYAFAEENATEDNGNDPYINMISLTDEAETPAISIDETLSEEEQQLKNDRIVRKEAAKKTDRYLVKYKSESGENKAGKKLKHKVKEKKEVKGKKEKKSKKTDLIILNEPIEPERFAEELRAMNIEDSIEYIQPDFRLNPSSVSLEVTLVGNSESNESPENSQMTEDGTPQSEDSESIESSNSSDASEQTVEEIPPQNTEQGSDATEDPADSSPEETAFTSKEENTQPEEGSQELSDAQPEENLQEPEELPTDQNSPVLVAVIDTGVDISHELIRDYLWSNEDQINGWNFIDENAEVFDTDAPWQDSHGTQVAGIIAQVAQNNQIPLQIVTCKVFENGTAYTSDVIEAIEFAQEKGAKVINMSFGGGFYNPALYDTMRDSNMLFITAAGNNRANLDETPVYPACFDLSNIVSVSSTNADGGFSFFSNYSTTQVDVTARGRDVVSALPGNQSGKFTGTSMSAAYVSGVAMAVYSQNAEMTKEQVKERILETSNRFDNLQDKVSRGRNINLQQALAGQIVSDVTHVNPADDFDVTSYCPTVNEQLTLFGSKQAVAGAVGFNHYLILMDDGTVWSFGRNEHGQLGSGEDEYAWHPYSQPVQVVGLSNIIKIAAGDHFSLALSADGTLWEWGQVMNDGGGIGSWESYTTPVQVNNIYNVQDVTAGNDSAAAIANGRQLYMWGYNTYGKILNCYGTVPQKVNHSFQGPDEIAVGHTTSGVVDALGTYGVGDNSSGQLGQGNTASYSGYQNLHVSPADYLAMGGSHAFGTSGMILFAWGNNTYGQLGIQNNYTNVTSAQVIPDAEVTSMALGENHSLFIQNINGTPTLYGCGDNSHKQLATLSCVKTDVITQIPAPEAGSVQAIAAGFNNSLAIYNGHAWIWGSNDWQQITTGTTTDVETPLQVGGIYQMDDPDSAFDIRWPLYYEGNIQLRDGIRRDAFKTEITEDGFYRIECSKQDASVSITPQSGSNGEILNHLDANSHEMIFQLTNGVYFVQVEAPTDGAYILQLKKEEYLNTVTQVEQDASGAIALDSFGRVWTWGEMYVNTQGDLHTFTKPHSVPLLTDVVQVARANKTNYALTSNGYIYVWGQVPQFQMWNDLNYYPRPVRMQMAPSTSFIAARDATLLAVSHDGTVWGIGDNTSQRITSNTTEYYVGEWTEIEGLAEVTKLAVGQAACAALKMDGTVWTWGTDNDALGRSAGNSAATPAQIPSLTGVSDVKAGTNHMLALTSSGGVFAWGSRSYGEIGDGTIGGSVRTPKQIASLSSIAQISVGENHNVVCTGDGDIYAWGSNFSGQCGTGADRISAPQRMFSSIAIDNAFAGNETTFGLTEGKLYGLGNNAGNVLQEGNAANYSSQVLVTGQHQNDSLETKKMINLFGEYKNAVDVTLPNNTPSYYYLVLGADSKIMLQGEGLAYEIYEEMSDSLVESGTCNGAKIIESLIPMNYNMKITTTGQKLFSVSVITSPDRSISLQGMTTGENYNIIVYGESMDSLMGTYSVTYDADYLEVVSACVLSDELDAGGNFSEFGIQILKNNPGIVEFSRSVVIPSGSQWTGAINIIRMRAKKSGNTTLNLLNSTAQ